VIRIGRPNQARVLAIAFLRKHTRWQREGMMLLIAGLSQSMTRNISTLRSIVTRCLAVGVLLCISCVGIVGTSALVASSTTADAPGGGAVAKVAVAEEAAFAAAAFVPRRP
jgi:hypothetical protein